MITSKRMSIAETVDFKFDLEYNASYIVLHLPRVDKFNKTVLKEMQSKVKEMYEFCDTVGYEGFWAAVETGDRRTTKLVRLLNFEGPIGSSSGYDVYQYKSAKDK